MERLWRFEWLQISPEATEEQTVMAPMIVRVLGCGLRTRIMSEVMSSCRREREREGAFVC